MPPYQFGYDSKIHFDREIKFILRHGARFRQNDLTLIEMDQAAVVKAAAEQKLKDIPRAWRRLAIRVSRKAGNAVRRNRIKRIFRELFRHEREKMKVGKDLLLLVRGVPSEMKLNKENLGILFTGLCKKAGLYSQ